MRTENMLTSGKPRGMYLAREQNMMPKCQYRYYEINFI